MIELFDDRLEITNPGTLLVEPERFVDLPPQSRNGALASIICRMGACEEPGSGREKVLTQRETHQLPPPLVEVTEHHTRSVLFAPRPSTKMNGADRVRAVYQHACLKWVTRQHMTNTTVRRRFGTENQNAAMALRLLKEAVTAGVIAPYDADVGPPSLRYVPVVGRVRPLSFLTGLGLGHVRRPADAAPRAPRGPATCGDRTSGCPAGS